MTFTLCERLCWTSVVWLAAESRHGLLTEPRAPAHRWWTGHKFFSLQSNYVQRHCTTVVVQPQDTDRLAAQAVFKSVTSDCSQ